MGGSQKINLYEARKNDAFKVTFVPDIRLLENLGIRVGTHVEIQTRYGLGGPVLLRVEDAYSVALGKDIAKQIELLRAGVPADAADADEVLEVAV